MKRSWQEAVLCSFVLLLHCAHQVPPSGGPPDKSPPRILKQEPSNLSTWVDPHARISITWSEWMDRRGFENAFFVNPPHLGKPRFQWSGAKVKISFDSSFRANTTYLFSLSTSVRDLHNVALEQPVSWAFSTGESLSRGKISGRVLSVSAANVVAAAYAISGDSIILPHSKIPDYLVGVSPQGQFQFNYVNTQRYRVFAFADENRDQLFQWGSEGLAIPSHDCMAATDSAQPPAPLVLVLSSSDTSSIALLSANALNMRSVLLNFNRMIPADLSLDKKLFRIFASDSGKMPLRLDYANRGESPSQVVLITSPQKYGTQYRIECRSLLKSATGVGEIGADTALFFSNTARDSVPPRVASIFPAARQTDVLPSDSIALVFSEPVNKYFFQQNARLFESDSLKVEFRSKDQDLLHAELFPASPFKTDASYLLRLDPGCLIDMFGNRNRDTLIYRFSTAKQDDLTRSVSGTVASKDTSRTVLIWKHLQSGREFRHSARGDVFSQMEMLKGKYLLRAFKDQNSNSRHDAGSLAPFSFSEPMTLYPDTLQLRGRWEFEGIKLEFAR